MNSDAIVNDICFELPLFSKLHSIVQIRNYFALHHLAIIGITLAILLRVI